MRFLADVNVPLPLIRFLIKQGHNVVDARSKYPKASDLELIQIAKVDNLVILTKDKDFLEFTQYPKYKIPLIAIRLKNQKTSNILTHIKDLLGNQPEDVLSKSITVVNEDIADSFPLEGD